MKSSYEAAYLEAEQTHPWFVARRQLFAALLAGPRNQRILDAGCGSAIFLRHLQARGYTRLEGFEPSARLREAAGREGSIVVHESFPEKSYDAIFMLDVLEHVAEDDAMVGTAFARLEEGGRLYLSVPAHPALWSGHDEANMHLRRYTGKELRRLLEAAGFHVERLSGWNTLLFAPVALMRLLRRGKTSFELRRPRPYAAALATSILRLENTLLLKTGLPVGLSLIAVAVKPGSGEQA